VPKAGVVSHRTVRAGNVASAQCSRTNHGLQQRAWQRADAPLLRSDRDADDGTRLYDRRKEGCT
jgi:hypothetical protein